MAGFLQDLRYGLRTLRNSPGFLVVGVLALGFGIGINSMVFTLLNAAILRPLPVKNSSEVVTIYQNLEGAKRLVFGTINYLSYPEYTAYRDQSRSLESLAAYATANMTLGGADARTIHAQRATCNYFDVVTQGLSLGRGFAEAECGPQVAGRVVVLSHRFWQRQFGADEQILGQSLVLNGQSYQIVGVAPEFFHGTYVQAAELWTPLSYQSPAAQRGITDNEANVSWLQAVGRLRSDASLTSVRADLAVVASRFDQQNPGRRTTLSVDRATLMNIPHGRQTAWAIGSIVLVAVSLVLLIACANLANLLLARAAARQKEIAVRLAIGASRFRLIRQLLAESLILALAGGGLGVLLSWRLLALLYPILVVRLPNVLGAAALDLTPDVRILLYSLAVSIVTAVGFGLLPALQASKLDLNGALKQGSGDFGGSRNRFRSALVAVQVAICLVLLISTGLLVRGLDAAQTIDPGFELKGVTIAELDLNRQGYDEARARDFHQRLAGRLEAQFGRDQVALVDAVPLAGERRQFALRLQGEDSPRGITTATVSPAYFQLLRIPILEGRPFEQNDVREGVATAIVSEGAARRFWPGQSAVGKMFEFGGTSVQFNVVGVAKDIRTNSLAEADEAFVYFALNPDFYKGARILLRSSAPYATAAKAIQDEVRTLDPAVLAQTTRMEDNPSSFQLPSKITAALGTILGVAGLLLASLGIYGVASFAVARRTREIGIRMSLGADRANVVKMILWQAMKPVAIGIVLGIAGSAGVSRILSSLLFGVSPLDPPVFLGVSLFLAIVALLASHRPARRAARIDPMSALRME